MTFKIASLVIPSDVTVFSKRTKSLYIGGAGNIKVAMSSGDAVVFSSLLGGTIYPLSVTKVFATGTTATNIIRLY